MTSAPVALITGGTSGIGRAAALPAAAARLPGGGHRAESGIGRCGQPRAPRTGCGAARRRAVTGWHRPGRRRNKVLPLLSDGGSVIFTVGIGATRGVRGGSVSAATKGALLYMVPSLAWNWRPGGSGSTRSVPARSTPGSGPSPGSRRKSWPMPPQPSRPGSRSAGSGRARRSPKRWRSSPRTPPATSPARTRRRRGRWARRLAAPIASRLDLYAQHVGRADPRAGCFRTDR
jgi:NAD(P)-dependent dehydrogenase (short-subunit alcohol dehydrogenase family)